MQEPQIRPYRADLDTNDGMRSPPLDWQYSSGCTAAIKVDVPVFLNGGKVQIVQQTVPQLTKDAVQKIQQAALAATPSDVQQGAARLRTVSKASGFLHPGTCMGPVEVATMQYRVRNGVEPQATAKDALLSGAGVPPKLYPGNWSVPQATPLSYSGPYAMETIDIKWSGINTDKVVCPQHYPAAAPSILCGHISLVEFDAEQSLKQAVAYLATGQQAYMANALRIVDVWAATNKVWGVKEQNGPLEAGWACATMAKTLELLRDQPAAAGALQRFARWVDGVMMPQMDFYADEVTPVNLALGTKHLYGNWHSTVAECFMSYGILTDNRSRYDKGVKLFQETLKDYLKWGRGGFTEGGRIIGECSETLRDIYHSQFGFGGLIQAAEIAWQQGEDLYSSSNYALVPALELHARIIRAYQSNDSSLLPSGFRFGDDMPPAPEGTTWKFDIRQQAWQAFNMTTMQPVANLTDGYKYLIGVMFLPTGWEVAHNHFVGRLGMKMPETAALLAGNWPEWQSFHWGLGSLSHAGTAGELWRPGVQHAALCSSQASAPAKRG